MKFLIIIFLLLSFGLSAQVNSNYHWVNGYYRSDGTYVEGHYRTNPNYTKDDNYTTIGNVNPHTGEIGTLSGGSNYTPSYYSSTFRPNSVSNDWKYNRNYELRELEEEIKSQEKKMKKVGTFTAYEIQQLLIDNGYNVDVSQVRNISINPDGSLNVTLFSSEKLQNNKVLDEIQEGLRERGVRDYVNTRPRLSNTNSIQSSNRITNTTKNNSPSHISYDSPKESENIVSKLVASLIGFFVMVWICYKY